MPRSLPRHVEVNRVKEHVYLSFRRGKCARIRLPGQVGSPEFEEAYAAALAGNVSARKTTREPAKAGTFEALIISYKRSSGFVQLRNKSKAGY